jgi:hypothetical protein
MVFATYVPYEPCLPQRILDTPGGIGHAASDMHVGLRPF